MNSKRITAVMVTALIISTLFGGCSSTQTTNTTESNNTSVSSTSDTSKQTEMKTVYTKVLSTLVSDKTITQDQSDQVLEALVKSAPGKQPDNQSDKQSDQKPSSDNQSGSAAAAPPADNRLTALVSGNVITKAQADTINQKIGEAIKASRGTDSTKSTQTN